MSLLDYPEAQRLQPVTGAAWLETTAGERCQIDQSCAIGRSASNQLVLAGEKISRHHAAIHCRSCEEYWLLDLGSVNGTWLNGRRLGTPTRLFHLDQVMIGPHRLIFRQPKGRTRPNPEPSLGERTIADAKPEYGWILMIELDSPSRVEQHVPSSQLPAVLGDWLDRCKGAVESHGGAVGRYLGSGLLAYWHDRATTRPAVANALRELARLQTTANPPFRFLLHYGSITLGHAEGAGVDRLEGTAVSFALRMEKLGRELKAKDLISEVAQALLNNELPMANIGRHGLPGFAGEQPFYSMAL